MQHKDTPSSSQMHKEHGQSAPAGSVEHTPSFDRALAAMEGTENVFITGKAGTGKSTLLTHWRAHTKKKNVVVLAPTGVAALNVGGQTIHSFFGFRPSVTIDDLPVPKGDKQKTLKALTTIVIDEISMVRADLLDCIDAMLRKWGPIKNAPFGGVHAIFIGDLYQLPPVVRYEDSDLFTTLYPTPYFFSARAFPQLAMAFVELEKIYRQTDDAFIGILNAIRTNTVTDAHIALLNTRVQKEPRTHGRKKSSGRITVTLTPTNARADAMNNAALARLTGTTKTIRAQIDGDMEHTQSPAPDTLTLKVGAQVMIVANDQRGAYVNGTMGIITALPKKKVSGTIALTVRTDDGRTIAIAPYTWEMYAYHFDADTQKITADVVGTYTQFPVRLAWALTIHKSQGKTFDTVTVDFDRGTFTHGHAYVALSRATSLAGLTLTQPFKKSHVRLDWAVVKFVTQYQHDRTHKTLSIDEKIALITNAIKQKKQLAVIYLKGSDERSHRTITPQKIYRATYKDKEFLVLEGLCHLRGDVRIFRVDRIVEIMVSATKKSS